MSAQFKSGTVIYRHWDQEAGLSEISRTFNTMHELFALCAQRESDLLVDRIVLDGEDRDGQARTVTLVFQSVNVTVHPPAAKAKDQAE